MADHPDRHILSRALDVLGRNPLSQADDSTLISAAQEVWYEHSSLELEFRLFMARDPDEIAVRRVGYLLEKLTRFACLSDDRASEALELLNSLLKHYRDHSADDPVPGTRLSHRRDELAISWGLSEGLGMKIQTLLPYQTRHYAATRNSTFGQP